MNRWKTPFPRNLYNYSLEIRYATIYHDEVKLSYEEFEENIDRIISGLTKHPEIIYAFFRDGIGFIDYSRQHGLNRGRVQNCITKFERECSKLVHKGLGYLDEKKRLEEQDPNKLDEDSQVLRLRCNGVYRLKDAGIYRISDLIKYSKSELLEIYGIGKVKANLIEEALAKHGFALRQDD